ncbi:glutamate racemase [Candidatus Uhrbacteria bacterium]|nr:glutamate racemase [Candidatus Uhrbacteria bacterium]
MNIGIFDSGFGGLTILKAISKLLPHYSYIYLGDNARSPYGDRSADRIYEFTRQGVEFLFKKDCKLVILACNTASALALRKLQQEWLIKNYPDRRILGIIIPVVEALAPIQTKKQKRVGVIGTRATILSNAYKKESEKRGGALHELIQQACPLLVPLIEEGWHKTPPAAMIIKKYIRPLKLKQVNVLVLGCTHYPLIKEKIQSVIGKNVRLIDPGSVVAHSLKSYLSRHAEIESALTKNSHLAFFTTDASERVASLASRFWGSHISFELAKVE